MSARIFTSFAGRSLFGILLLTLLAPPAPPRVARADDELRDRLKDENVASTDVWVYNDIGKAMEQARRENKPLFVTFRCVPCQACAAFDADVANGNDRVRALARDKFVSVRQVEMKGVDLDLFQFDHDLNWAAMFVHADGTVYARYGTQSAEGPDAYNSIDGLLNTMNRVLEMHAAYPENATALEGKRGKKREFKTALEMPGLENPEKYSQQTTRSNCIHCHNIHDAENMHAQKTGRFSRDLLWRYPLPDRIGLTIDKQSGIEIADVAAGSPAAEAGLSKGEKLLRMNGQTMTSIADMQWVLHHLPNDDTELVVEGSRTGERGLKLKKGWKQYDVSWRGSLWSVSPKLRVWAPELEPERRRALGIAREDNALLVKWINRGAPGGRSAYDSGLREGDVIVRLAGEPIRMDNNRFNLHVKLNYKVGDELPITVIRGEDRKEIRVKLVE